MGVTAYTTVQVGPHSGDLSFFWPDPRCSKKRDGAGGGGGGAVLLGRPIEFLLSGVRRVRHLVRTVWEWGKG